MASTSIQTEREIPREISSREVQGLPNSELVKLSPYYIAPQYRQWMLIALALGHIFLTILIVSRPVAIQSIIGSLLISTIALVPLWLWVLGRSAGLPLFPIFSTMFVFSHGTPLITSSEALVQFSTVDNMVLNYTSSAHLQAALKVSFYLVLANFMWLLAMSRPLVIPRTSRVLHQHVADTMFLSMLFFATLFMAAQIGNWVSIAPGVINILRVLFLGLSGLATAMIFYRVGRKDISHSTTTIAIVLVILLAAVGSLTLYLDYSFGLLGVALASFSLGRGRIPIFCTLLILAAVTLLHHGKGEMRYKYWHLPALQSLPPSAIQPYQYVDMYIEWFRNGWDDLRYVSESERENNLANWRLLDRLSLIQMLLLVQEQTSRGKPLLHGATLSPIPQALVPRFLYPSKVPPHEGAFRLGIHYGFLTPENKTSVFIEWGPLAESYANFGMVGVFAMALIIGNVFAFLTRLSMFTPVLSLRTMLAVLMTILIMQVSSSIGVLVVTTMHSLIGLSLVGFLMQKRPLQLHRHS